MIFATRGANSAADVPAVRRRGLEPDLWFGDAAPDPDGEERRQNADEEHAAPAPARHHDQVHERREAVADRPRALHERQRLAPVTRGKRFRHERRPRRPLPAHPEAEHDAEHGQLERRLREAAGGGEDRVDQDRRDQRARPANPVGDHAEDDAPDGRGEQRDGSKDARHAERQVKGRVSNKLREDERVQHYVERIEHPSERRGDKRASRRLVGFGPPGQRTFPHGSRYGQGRGVGTMEAGSGQLPS